MRILLLFFGLISLFGCKSIDPTDPFGRALPVRPNWSVKVEAPDPRGVLCYDCIYYAKLPGDPEYDIPAAYSAYRFWASGHVMHRTLMEFPTQEAMDRFGDDSRFGFYKIENSRIFIELFSTVAGGTYGINEGLMRDGELFLEIGYLRHRRGSPFERNREYQIISKQDFELEPDW